jgi:hypothetical protein
MAKRKKAVPKTTKPTKKATPANPKPKEPSAINVNPRYDEMPDTIEDPAAVFRMAMLDMKRAAIHNKLAVVVQEHEKRVAAAVAARDNAIRETKAELQDAERQFIEQKQNIEKTYGIALRSYNYNDETGVLTKQSLPEEEPEPESPSAKDAEGAPNKTLH